MERCALSFFLVYSQVSAKLNFKRVILTACLNILAYIKEIKQLQHELQINDFFMF